MPTYLLTQDILNVSVSCFANYDTPWGPVEINLLTWLKSKKYRSEIKALRLVDDKAERDVIKATLPAITPSGTFTYRQTDKLIQHSKLIQFDIDLKDNLGIRNYSDLKYQISKFPFVAFCAVSASGKGYWGLVPIAYPERHSQHFDALKRAFAEKGINLDNKPRNVSSLRGYSYDPEPYMPDQVMLFDFYDEPLKQKPKPRPPKLSRDTVPNYTEDKRKLVEICIQEILQLGTYLGDNYDEWCALGCSLANGFGETGRGYYHQLSQNYHSYQTDKTDKQFTACLKASSGATLGTFFHLCRQVGIEWKDLVPLSEKSASMNEEPASVFVTSIVKQNTFPSYTQLERETSHTLKWGNSDAVATINKTVFKWRRIIYDFVSKGLIYLRINESS